MLLAGVQLFAQLPQLGQNLGKGFAV